jgi:recombinase
MLRNPRYAGLRYHQGEYVGEAVWPAIVSADTWRALTSIINDPARNVSPGPARKWLLMPEQPSQPEPQPAARGEQGMPRPLPAAM